MLGEKIPVQIIKMAAVLDMQPEEIMAMTFEEFDFKWRTEYRFKVDPKKFKLFFPESKWVEPK